VPIDDLFSSWFPDGVGATTVTATMTKTLKADRYGIYEDIGSHYGLALHATVNQNEKADSGYFFTVAGQYDSRGKHITGDALISRMDKRPLSGRDLLITQLCRSKLYSGFAKYVVNGPDTLAATIDAEQNLIFTVNGTEVCRAHDATYSRGSVMIASSFSSPWTLGFSVSSLTIEAPGFKPSPALPAREAADRVIRPVSGPDTVPRND
jgi:hypothetical protein